MATRTKVLAAEYQFFEEREDAAYWAATLLSKDSFEYAEAALDWGLSSLSTFSYGTYAGSVVSVQRVHNGFKCAISRYPGWLRAPLLRAAVGVIDPRSPETGQGA